MNRPSLIRASHDSTTEWDHGDAPDGTTAVLIALPPGLDPECAIAWAALYDAGRVQLDNIQVGDRVVAAVRVDVICADVASAIYAAELKVRASWVDPGGVTGDCFAIDLRPGFAPSVEHSSTGRSYYTEDDVRAIKEHGERVLHRLIGRQPV